MSNHYLIPNFSALTSHLSGVFNARDTNRSNPLEDQLRPQEIVATRSENQICQVWGLALLSYQKQVKISVILKALLTPDLVVLLWFCRSLHWSVDISLLLCYNMILGGCQAQLIRLSCRLIRFSISHVSVCLTPFWACRSFLLPDLEKSLTTLLLWPWTGQLSWTQAMKFRSWGYSIWS